MTYAKIELHVHLDSAMRASLLLRLARRNDYVLPFATVEEFADYGRVASFPDLGRIWVETCGVLKREQDFREVLVAYAGEAKSHGAVYVEAIFNPWMMWKRGVSLDSGDIPQAHRGCLSLCAAAVSGQDRQQVRLAEIERVDGLIE